MKKKQTTPTPQKHEIYSAPLQPRGIESYHLRHSRRLGVDAQVSLRLGLCGTRVETLREGPRFISMFVGGHLSVENPLPILTSEQHCSLFALCTRSLSREFDMLKPQNISPKIFWVQLCKYSAPYVTGPRDIRVLPAQHNKETSPLETAFSASHHRGS